LDEHVNAIFYTDKEELMKGWGFFLKSTKIDFIDRFWHLDCIHLGNNEYTDSDFKCYKCKEPVPKEFVLYCKFISPG